MRETNVLMSHQHSTRFLLLFFSWAYSKPRRKRGGVGVSQKNLKLILALTRDLFAFFPTSIELFESNSLCMPFSFMVTSTCRKCDFYHGTWCKMMIFYKNVIMLSKISCHKTCYKERYKIILINSTIVEL